LNSHSHPTLVTKVIKFPRHRKVGQSLLDSRRTLGPPHVLLFSNFPGYLQERTNQLPVCFQCMELEERVTRKGAYRLLWWYRSSWRRWSTVMRNNLQWRAFWARSGNRLSSMKVFYFESGQRLQHTTDGSKRSSVRKWMSVLFSRPRRALWEMYGPSFLLITWQFACLQLLLLYIFLLPKYQSKKHNNTETNL